MILRRVTIRISVIIFVLINYKQIKWYLSRSALNGPISWPKTITHVVTHVLEDFLCTYTLKTVCSEWVCLF